MGAGQNVRFAAGWPERPPAFTDADAAKAMRYAATVDVVVWTPGIAAGNPLFLSMLPDFAALGDDPDERAQAVTMAATRWGRWRGQEQHAEGRARRRRSTLGALRKSPPLLIPSC